MVKLVFKFYYSSNFDTAKGVALHHIPIFDFFNTF